MELPLVIFSLLSQMAVGGFLYLWVSDLLTKDAATPAKLSLQKALAYTLVPLMALSLIASLFHLGRPFFAYRAISGLDRSWLSREVALFGAFFFLLLIYAYLWGVGSEMGEIRRLFGLLGLLVGLGAVFATSMVYLLPARPSWNHFNTILSFFFTTLLLGGFLLAIILALKLKWLNERERRDYGVKFFRSLSYLVIIIILGELVTLFIQRSYLLTASLETQSTADLLYQTYSYLLGLKIVLSLVVPFLLALGILRLLRKNALERTLLLIYVGFFSLLAGEFLGRILFFLTVVPTSVGGPI